MTQDPFGFGAPPKEHSKKPIVVLVLALLASGAGNYWLWQERQRGKKEVADAVAKVTAAETATKEATQKLQDMHAEAIAGAASAKPEVRDKDGGTPPDPKAKAEAKPEAKDDDKDKAEDEDKAKDEDKPKPAAKAKPAPKSKPKAKAKKPAPKKKTAASKAPVDREL